MVKLKKVRNSFVDRLVEGMIMHNITCVNGGQQDVDLFQWAMFESKIELKGCKTQEKRMTRMLAMVASDDRFEKVSVGNSWFKKKHKYVLKDG